MNDDEASSGSRWEPAVGSPVPQPGSTTDWHAAATAATTLVEAGYPNPVPPVTRTQDGAGPRSRRRVIAAALAVACLLVGGGAGFAIGRATAPASGGVATFGHGRGGPGGFHDGGVGNGSDGAGAGTSGSGTAGSST